MIVPSSFDSPVLADKYIQNLQTALDTLTWLEYVYPCARMGVDDDGRTYPMVSKNDGSRKNYNVLFDTDVRSYCYFELDGAVGFSDGNFNGGDEDMTIPLSLVVWGRLDKIYPTKAYDYTSELVQDVMNILKYCANTAGYRINALTGVNYSTDYNDVFGRYSSYDEKDWRGTMRMMTAFRVNFTISVDSTCDLQEGTSPIVVSSDFYNALDGIADLGDISPATAPTVSQINAALGVTPSSAGEKYAGLVTYRYGSPTVNYSGYLVLSNGTSWYALISSKLT